MPGIKKPRVPSYRLHKPSGQAVVRLGGKDFYLGSYGSDDSQTEYRRLIAEWMAGHRHVPVDASSGHEQQGGRTINELVVAYWEFVTGYYVKNGQPTGEQQAIKYSIKPLSELYGRIPITDFGPRSLKTVREQMIEGDLSRALVNARIKRIRRMFKWGVENELVASSILHGLQAVAPLKKGRCQVREAPPIRPVPEAHIEAMLPHVARPVAAMIRLQMLTGMRPGEVTMMRGCDLDTTGKLWAYTPESHKTEHHDRKRVIYLGPKAQRVLGPMLKADLQAYLFSPVDAVQQQREAKHAGRRTPFSCGNRPGTRRKASRQKQPGERYTTQSYGRAIDAACDKAFPPPEELRRKQVPARGRKSNALRWESDPEWRDRLGPDGWAQLKQWRHAHRWSPNQLRHNAATYLRKEFGIEAARVVLGHSSAAVTEVYAELDLAKAAEIMGKVG